MEVKQVEFKVTANVRNHKYNRKYPCLLVKMKPKKGTHIEFTSFAPPTVEWMIKDVEAKQITVKMANRSPTYLAWLREFMADLGPKEVAAFV